LERARMMARHGTTTAEAKSGYGLNVADELKQLRAIRDADERSPVRLVPTCLAAHEFPSENREEYVDEIVNAILPAVAREELADFCDAFVERSVFTREQGERVLRAGIALGLDARMHADEFSDSGGATLAASLR